MNSIIRFAKNKREINEAIKLICRSFPARYKKEVKFNDDDDFENFYELYGYDVDEQPSEVFDKISHTSILLKNNINDFYKKYELNKKIIKVKKLKRVNKVCCESK